MLDDNPVLKERLMACGAFAGIALFAVTAVDVMLTGGFDFAPGRNPAAEQPGAYVRVVGAAQYVSDRVRTISWDEPMLVDDAAAANSEQLAGANDGSTTPMSAEPSGDDLYSEIASLYERGEPEAAYVEEPSYEDTPAYDDEAVEEFSPEEAEKLASAYGSG